MCSAACARRQIAKPIQRESAQCSKSVFFNTVFTEQSRPGPDQHFAQSAGRRLALLAFKEMPGGHTACGQRL